MGAIARTWLAFCVLTFKNKISLMPESVSHIMIWKVLQPARSTGLTTVSKFKLAHLRKGSNRKKT